MVGPLGRGIVALLTVVGRDEVFGLGQTERLKPARTVYRNRFSDDADVVASFVEERDPAYHEVVRAVRKHRHSFGSVLVADFREFVDVVTGEGAEDLGGREVTAGQEVDA